jgi:hypothetical protein
MNANLVNIIKRIIAEQGEDILGDPARLKGFVAGYAAAESRAERLAFGRCIEHGAYNELKNAPDTRARQLAKAAVVRRVVANEGLDPALCNGALDALEAALYGAVTLPQYQQPAYQQYQVPPAPGVRTGGLWAAVLVCNILGLNWISRFITGHVGTGILVLLLHFAAIVVFYTGLGVAAGIASLGLWMIFLLDAAAIATLAVGIGIILGIVYFIIWIVDLVKIGTKKWQMADGTYLAP